jgi:hypothetical protein
MLHRLFACVVALLVSSIFVCGSVARAQTCGTWLAGPSAPDVGANRAVLALGSSNSELYANTMRFSDSASRVAVLRAGVWQELPWDETINGQIRKFSTKSGLPTVVTTRTASTTPPNKTVEIAIRSYTGSAWATQAAVVLTMPSTEPVNIDDFAISNGSWYVSRSTGRTGTLYKSTGSTLALIATTDIAPCVVIISTCAVIDPRAILALQTGTDGLYLGGRFESITPASTGTPITIKNLAKYDGTNFTALPSSPNGRVRGMLLDNTISILNANLLVWGEFSQIGTTSYGGVARWNAFNNAWAPVGAGLTGGAAAIIQVPGQTLNAVNYIAINAYPTTGVNYGIAKWTGSAWENFGGGENVAIGSPGGLMSVTYFNNSVIVGGTGVTAWNSPRYGVAKWSGSSWDYVASQAGTDGISRATTTHAGFAYLAGDFTRINGVSASHVVRYDHVTGTYTPVGAGVNGSVTALVSFGGELIAGGTFSSAGAVSVTNVAAWNGTAWRALGAGLDGAVRGFTTWNGSLVAVGSFRHSGATTTGSAARWTGSAWVAIDATFVSADLYAAAVLGTTLHVGGPAGLRRYNGSTFEVVGGNVNGAVYALFPLLGSLYVGGDFTTVSSPALNYRRLARWNGTQWFPVGPNAGADVAIGSVRTIFGSTDEIYIGGDFQVIISPGQTATNIARYDGVTWRRLDTEYPNAPVTAGTIAGDRVWAVGDFTLVNQASITPTEGFGAAQWSKAPAFLAGPQNATVCATNGTAQATFTVMVSGTPAPMLRWYRGATALTDGLRISGSTTNMLTIAAIGPGDLGQYTCVATDACSSSTTSNAASLSTCIADFDCSGAKNIDDIFIYLNAWFTNDPRCDVTAPASITIDDLFVFINIWFAGC